MHCTLLQWMAISASLLQTEARWRNAGTAPRAAEALRSEAERFVEGLFREKKDAAEVVAAVRADRSLSKPQRDAAFRAVLRGSAKPGN